jgi:hypothetical protein
MNKHAPPQQLDLTAGKTREELLIQALPPHVDPESPAFKTDMAKVEKIEKEETARAVLGTTSNYDDFDWTNDPSVVLQEQRATAVYQNAHGGIVIRQEKYWNEESDPHVVICQENFVTFSEALAKKAREG